MAEERDLLGPIQISKVAEAQRLILRVIRELSDRGVIEHLHASGEQLV